MIQLHFCPRVLKLALQEAQHAAVCTKEDVGDLNNCSQTKESRI